MARVGIDLDGVCYDFGGSFFRYLKMIDHEAVRPFPTFPESTTFNFFEEWGMDLHEFLGHVHDGVDAGVIFTGPARPGAREALQWLRDAGHTIVIVTHRTQGSDDQAQRNTIQWLEDNDLVYDELHFDEDKTGYRTDYFIEDQAKNWHALREAGVYVWLVDRPWNQDATEIGPEYRCDGIREFARWVIQEEIVAEQSAIRAAFGEVRTVSPTGGEKGVKAARFDLIPANALWSLAELYGAGALKYEDRNWERGYEWSKSYAAAQRHLNAFWQGQADDPEMTELSLKAGGSAIPHVICAAWHCLALAHFILNPADHVFDDRPAPTHPQEN